MEIKQMKSVKYLIATVLLAGSISCANQSPGGKVEEATRRALKGMKQLQKNGGWAMAWADDGSATYGEWLLREDDIITVQPPATPGIGMTYLKAYRVLGDSTYLNTAMSAGDALIRGQLGHGGFPQEFYPDLRVQDSTWFQESKGDGWPPAPVEGADFYLERGPGTFDDATTQFAAQFLLKLWEITGRERFSDAAEKSTGFMLNAQYSNGGWPQKYPLRDNYTRYITLNDDAMMDVMRTLFRFWEVTGDSVYYRAAVRGADCLLDLQAEPPQAGWAQQYTADGEPVGARPWEPVTLSSSESVDVLKVLKEVYMATGDKKYLETGEEAFTWLTNSKLENGRWARYYEIGTNKPIYSGEGGNVTYDYEEALKYHPGYSWQGDYFDQELRHLYQQLLAAPVEERMDLIDINFEDIEKVQKQALAVANSLNNEGFWIQPMEGSRADFYRGKFGIEKSLPNVIQSGTFVTNTNRLLDYLDRSK